MQPYILYTHHDPEITTIDEFLDQFGLSIAKQLTPDELLQYTDQNGLSNLDRVWLKYNRREKKAAQLLYDNGTLVDLKVGTVLALPKDKLFRETLSITGSNQVVDVKKFSAFLSQFHAQLLKSSSYVQTSYYTGDTINKTKISHPRISVWLWSKAIGGDRLLDVTPFLISCTTNVDENGGNFQLSFAPITCSLNEQNQWIIHNTSVSDFFAKNELISFNQTNRKAGGQYKQSNFLMNTIVSPNDVVFIRFEPLKIESSRNRSFFIDKTRIPSSEGDLKLYDMIGLVDSNLLSYSAEGNDVTVNITGKDLAKVLIDDGSYFYPLQFAQGVFINPNENDKLIKRLAVDGQFILQSAFTFRSIRFALQFIMNHLSNIAVTTDSLFSAYGDRRSEVFRLEQQNTNEIQYQLSIIKNNAIREIEQYSDGNAASIFDNIVNLIQAAVAQDALVVNGVSLIGYDSFTFQGQIVAANTTPTAIAGQDVFLFKQVSALSNDSSATIGVEPSTIFLYAYEHYRLQQTTYNRDIESRPARGIWQIIKLLVDENVADRRIADSSISQPDGSLINQVWKVCQKPFVEFITDTYGDSFYFIARRPPFDKAGIKGYINAQYHTDNEEETFQVPGERSTLILDIDPADVLSFEVQYQDSEIYSFYEIQPQGLFLGAGSSVSLAYIPIIYFPQYADIWGSRRLSVVSNYLPYSGLTGSNQKKDRNFVVEQTAIDLKFVIDINAYLPFTRRGSITLNGDRRIKRGTWIRHVATGELFYVSSVSHSYSISNQIIDRTTTLQVERGMFEKYIDHPTYSYFNIVDTELIRQYIVSSLTGGSNEAQLEIKRNFAVNQEVFDFFVNRLQNE